MPKKIRRLNPRKHTKADMIRDLIRIDPSLTRREAGNVYGDEEYFSEAQFSVIRQEVRKALGLASKKKQLQLFKEEKEKEEERAQEAAYTVPAENVPSPALPTTAGEVHTLLRENAYLRWQLEGERQGFFDRWVEETANAGVNG